MAYPQPANVQPWYLRNITQALELDEATGNVFVRTNAQLVGNVSVGNVAIGALGNIDISGNSMPITGNVTVFQGTIPWSVTGTITSGNINANVTGGNVNVAITSGNVGVTGNIAGITANVTVVDGGGSITVDGNVGVSGNVGILGNVNVTQGTTPWSVTGTVTANLAANASVDVSDFNPAYLTAFEELNVTEMDPRIQMDATYGLRDLEPYVVQIGNGTAGANSNISVFYANSSTTTGSSGQIASDQYLRYRPGQGAMARFTAAFTSDVSGNGVGNVTQRAGLFHYGEAYQFGFSGDTASGNTGIGIVRAYGGTPEIRTLTITTAPTGAQTATITLDGTAYTAAISSGTAANAAAQIATGNVWGNKWYTDQTGNTVIFMRNAAGPLTGTYSFSSSGAGTLAAGTFARTTAGVAATNVWTYKADWNGAPVTFDPSKLNVYAIDFRWLGAGIVRFFMEDPATGGMTLVHTQKYANTSTQPHVLNPSFRLGWVSACYNGGAASPGVVTGASAMGAIQGDVQPTLFSKSYFALDSGTRAQNILHHLLSIRNPRTRVGKENTLQIYMQNLSVALQGTDPSVIFVFLNPTLSVLPVWSTIPGSSILYSTTTATISTATNTPVSTFTVGINGSSAFDLIPYVLSLSAGDFITVGVYSTNSITNSSAALTWGRE